MKRKSPIKHKVRSHIRKGRKVQTYDRGHGTKKTVLWKNSKGKTDFNKSLIRQINKSKSKIDLVLDFTRDTWDAHGRSYEKILSDTIPKNSMTKKEFLNIFSNNSAVRDLDEEWSIRETGEEFAMDENPDFNAIKEAADNYWNN